MLVANEAMVAKAVVGVVRAMVIGHCLCFGSYGRSVSRAANLDVTSLSHLRGESRCGHGHGCGLQ